MVRLRIAICLEDREYQNRFTNCIMNHYQNKFELHVFTGIEEFLEHQADGFQGIIISGYEDELLRLEESINETYIYLYDDEQILVSRVSKAVYIEKYSDVSYIMEEVMRHIKDEMRALPGSGNGPGAMIIGVYGLSKVEYQLPFAITLASILQERTKVLFVDLEENSGLSHLFPGKNLQGMEELMVMAESGKYSRNRMLGCIGESDHLEYIYPTLCTDRISESTGEIMRKLTSIIRQELDYSIILVNLGVRFRGFFDLIADLSKLYLVSSSDHIGAWREEEFLEELSKEENKLSWQRVQKVELPDFQILLNDYERTVEQWKWSEMGEYIRKLVIQEGLFAEDSREYSASSS